MWRSLVEKIQNRGPPLVDGAAVVAIDVASPCWLLLVLLLLREGCVVQHHPLLLVGRFF